MADGTMALHAALQAARHLNEAMRALQDMQSDMDHDLGSDMRDVERTVDDARDVVLGTRRLLQVRLGLIDRETDRPVPPLAMLRHDSTEGR